MRIEDIVQLSPVIPVLTLTETKVAVPLAQALLRGGLRVLEVTLRTPQALAAIRAIRDAVPDAIIGAGTALDANDLHVSREAGAQFAVSPGAPPELLRAAKEHGVPLLPGIATATELMTGLAHGYGVFKFFPADNLGGPAALSALAAPFSRVMFCPTGGVTLQSAKSYLALPAVVCVGGSWLAPRDAIAAHDWQRIANLAEEACKTLAR